MKNGIVQLFFLVIISTFSLIWISDKVSVVLEKEKYGFHEMSEKSETENQTENKLKTRFFEEIELLNLSKFSILSSQKNPTFYLFKIKEPSFENRTPPPEKVKLQCAIFHRKTIYSNSEALKTTFFIP